MTIRTALFNPVPFEERKSPLRGILDVITLRYPRFCFGGEVGKNILPVFHFHDVTEKYLRPYIEYLAVNGYKTVCSDELESFVKKGIKSSAKSVVLCFDDAWRSLWTVVFPLLAEFEMKAIAYVIPARVEEAVNKRPFGKAGENGSLFATWPEITEMKQSGIIDIQAHTYSHALIYCDPHVVDFVHPDLQLGPTEWPALQFGKTPLFVSPDMLGCPLYPCRSRMSDAFLFKDDEAVRNACIEHVNQNGGRDFFSLPDWRKRLTKIAKGAKHNWELVIERERAIYQELVMAKESLEARLGRKTITQVCFPWAVCGKTGEAMAKKAGYNTAVADILFGKRAAVRGGNPYRIMRLKHNYIFCLPGEGRKNISTIFKER